VIGTAQFAISRFRPAAAAPKIAAIKNLAKNI
jgi:hypothetical protein